MENYIVYCLIICTQKCFIYDSQIILENVVSNWVASLVSH